MGKPVVGVLVTSPKRVLDDYARLMRLVNYNEFLTDQYETIIKLNLSWTLYFPACSSQPWQLEGVVRTLLEDGRRSGHLLPVENKTVVTNPTEGAKHNKWVGVLERYGLKFIPLTDVEWVHYEFKTPLLKLNRIFPRGIEIPKMFIGRTVLHLPTLKTHGHSVTTGAIKNAFGGLLKEVRHYGHEFIHEVLVDLLLMQREIHPNVFAVMDGTVAGDGAGPRTMRPVAANLILASGDSVAIDAVAARIMGFDPLSIPYLRMAHERELGVADPRQIEIVGDSIDGLNLGFSSERSLVIKVDQMLRRGSLRPLKRLALHSPLWVWAPVASTIYHDYLWYPIVGRKRIREFARTEWGRLFKAYGKDGGPT
jgi:uncharacterized protein (DUF362 family)